MGLSQHLTELIERWLGQGEMLPETSPRVSISNGTVEAGVMPTNGDYGLVTIEPNHISTLNSTTDLLGIGATFTGTGEDITNYAVMFINVYSDVASATDGFCIDASYNGTDWHETECYTINAGVYKTFSIQCASKFIRIRYTNGAVAQTDFHLEVKLCTKNALDSSHRIADQISSQDDARLVKSVLTGKQPDGDFTNIGATTSGNLKTTDAEDALAIAKGQVIGSTKNNKWGNAPNFATSNGEIDIWDGADDGQTWEQMTYVFSSTAAIDSISSSSASDTVEVTIEGLDANYNQVSLTPILNGQNRVALGTSLLRVNRAYNSNGVDFVGNVIIYENTAIVGGVPTDTTKIKAIIDPTNQQTEMAIYTVPAGKTGYILGGYASTAGANKSSNYKIKFTAREPNGVFRTKQRFSVSDNGSSFVPFKYEIPEDFPEKTDLRMTAQMTATGGTNGSVSAGFGIILVDN